MCPRSREGILEGCLPSRAVQGARRGRVIGVPGRGSCVGKHTEAGTSLGAGKWALSSYFPGKFLQNRIPVNLAYGAKVGRRAGEMGRSSGMAQGLRLWLRLHGKVQVRKPSAAPTQTERAKPSSAALRMGGGSDGHTCQKRVWVLAQRLLDSLGWS